MNAATLETTIRANKKAGQLTTLIGEDPKGRVIAVRYVRRGRLWHVYPMTREHGLLIYSPFSYQGRYFATLPEAVALALEWVSPAPLA